MNKAKRKNPLRFWLIVTAVLVLPAVLLAVWRLSMASEFDRRVEALAEQGFPVSLDDLEKAYVLPEGVENAADIYMEAFSYYQEATAEEIDSLPISGNYIRDHDAPPLPDEVIEALETHLKNNQKTLELLDKAAKIKHCLWPRTRNGRYLEYSHFLYIKKAVMLLCERQLYLAHKGQTDKLFNSFQTSIALAKRTSIQPVIIELLISSSLKTLCAKNLETIMPQVDFTDAQLKTLQKYFADMQNVNAFKNSLIYERSYKIEFWRSPPEEQAKFSFRQPSMPVRIFYSTFDLKHSDAQISLDLIENQMAALTLPLHERIEALEKIVKNEKDMNSDLLWSMRSGYIKTAAGSSRSLQFEIRYLGDMKCAETGIALERYRKQHNALPESLDALVPEFMAQVPRDPFDNQPLRYIKLDDGFTVYSIGEDCIDNDGLSRKQMKKKTGSSEPCDWPFTVQHKK